MSARAIPTSRSFPSRYTTVAVATAGSFDWTAANIHNGIGTTSGMGVGSEESGGEVVAGMIASCWTAYYKLVHQRSGNASRVFGCYKLPELLRVCGGGARLRALGTGRVSGLTPTIPPIRAVGSLKLPDSTK
jgi:hypothetical protein